ncbi:MAG: hypothetical protein WD638_12535 [Nitriliruptoraceae bacterium]
MAPGEDPRSLQRQQQLWTAFVVGVLLLATLLTLVVDVTPTLPIALPLVLALALGAAGYLATVGIDRVFAASPPADDGRALGELRARLVLQAVIAESLVLVTTVMAATIGPRWSIAIGGLAALAILLRVRPRTSRLARFDAAWAVQEADVSLLRGLAGRNDPEDPGPTKTS